MVLKVDTFSVYKPSIGKRFVFIQIQVESERHLQLSRAVPVYSYLVIIVIGGDPLHGSSQLLPSSQYQRCVKYLGFSPYVFKGMLIIELITLYDVDVRNAVRPM